MRLTDSELTSIKKTFHEYFAPEDKLWLFGSRANDNKRGGDIDLYIETNETDTKKAISNKMDFVIALYPLIGDQKIDVVLNQLSLQSSLAIYDVAKTQGVRLV